MTPDSAPTVQQLLAFYLEAGVDCALTDEPVNRLTDPVLHGLLQLPAPELPLAIRSRQTGQRHCLCRRDFR